MDAFYASVEQRENPQLRGKPVAVGGSKRGVVMTASYEARKFGVRSAMPSGLARKLCPQLLFVKPQFDVYKSVSLQIREIFGSYSDLVESVSIDEAYLDVTRVKRGPPSATLVAKAIKEEIYAQTELTASAGVSFNKFLAKTASGLNKPDGLTVILPENVRELLDRLPVSNFHGIGPKTAAAMKIKGIETGADLLKYSKQELVQWFGKAGRYYYRIVRGQDERDVHTSRIRKSLGAERTFFEDIHEVSELLERLHTIADTVANRLQVSELYGRTLTLKVKYYDFVVNTRSRTLKRGISSSEEVFQLGSELLHTLFPLDRPIRLLGLSLTNLSKKKEDSHQIPLPFCS